MTRFLILLLACQSAFGASWYNQSWPYRRAIVITNTVADTPTNCPISMTVSSSETGWSHMAVDGADVRFTAADGTTLIPFYRQAWSAGEVGIKRRLSIGSTYSTGNAIGKLTSNAGNQTLVGFGTDLNVNPVTGVLVCFDSLGNALWTHTSPNSDFPMGVDIGDVDGDGVNEIAVGYRTNDHIGQLLNKDGVLLWSYDMGAGSYVRTARIGELRSDYSGKEVVFGNQAGKVALLSSTGAVIWTTNLAGANIQSGVIADIDADGTNDIVLSVQSDSSITVLDPQGGVKWHTGLTGDPMGVSVGDVTGSAGLEVLSASGRATNRLSLLDSAGAILWTTNYDSNEWCSWIADISGSGIKQLLVGYGSHDVATPAFGDIGGVLWCNSSGVLQGRIQLPNSVKVVSSGDYDGDGSIELAASCDDGALYLIGNGQSTFYPTLPTIAASTITTVYMYYGNPSASSVSDATYNPLLTFVGADGSQPTGWTDQNGDWAIHSNKARSPDSGDTATHYALGLDSKNYQNFTATIVGSKPRSGTGGAADYWLGCYYRVQGWSNGLPAAYRVRVGLKGGCTLDRVVLNSTTEEYRLASGSNPLFTTNDTVTITVIAAGDTHNVDVSVNGAIPTRVISVTDANGDKISSYGSFALLSVRGVGDYTSATILPRASQLATFNYSQELNFPTRMVVGTLSIGRLKGP